MINGACRTLARINGILVTHGWGTTFGHSFSIGGASFDLAQKVDSESFAWLGVGALWLTKHTTGHLDKWRLAISQPLPAMLLELRHLG